jgi:uncharacterized protein YjiK
LLACDTTQPKPVINLVSDAKYALNILEPSDIAYSAASNTYFVVSDNGYLYEIDAKGATLRKADYTGYDFEAVYVQGDKVFVSEERTRLVLEFDRKTLTKTHTYSIPDNGARNKGVESLTFDSAKSVFIAVTEKSPIKCFEFSTAWTMTNVTEITGISDISAATYHEGVLYLLSDEEHCILRMGANYSIEQRYELPILNLEGMCFQPDGSILVVSDDLQTLYHFPKP